VVLGAVTLGKSPGRMSENYVEKVMPLNAETTTTLQDRLVILDKLSALRKANPRAQYHDVTPNVLPLTGGAVAAMQLFAWLKDQRIAAFAPTDETNIVIWHNSPVHITAIDRKRLRQARKSTVSKLKQLHRVTPVAAVPKQPRQPRHGFWSKARGFPTAAIAVFIASVASAWRFVRQHWPKVKGLPKAIGGLVLFLAAVATIWAFVVSQHWHW
jgi:hypothetical protein